MFPDDIERLARQVIEQLTDRKMMIATAESCTGGLIASALTEIPGSSSAVHGGFVTYANKAKQRMVGVPKRLLDEYGAVSEQAARAMAEGALKRGRVDIAVAVTGVAGPDGGSDEKPVGLVHFACALPHHTAHLRCEFGNPGRHAVRLATVRQALQLVLEALPD